MLYAVVAVALVVLILILWQAFAPGPRRKRAYRRAGRLLDAGDWQAALQLITPFLQSTRSESWRTRLRQLAGESHQQALEKALQEKRFEEALEHAPRAGEFLNLDEADLRSRVFETMLAEIRLRFAQSREETEPVRTLSARLVALATERGAPIPPEVHFWEAMCEIREGQLETALIHLTNLHERVGKQVIDPAFYLGVLLHRMGRPQEALRYLGEANRVDSSCPFVTWQMGLSIVAAGGESMDGKGDLALRALQRALGPRGLLLWQAQPERVWVEGFPEARSYVRRLATKHRYICPLLGGELAPIIRQGQLALAQAFYRTNRFQEAADLYAQLLQSAPPTPMLLRGYGLSLARLGQYDHAYKQLRIALEQEDPKDPFTAGYLALCGALGKPTRPEDKPRNIAWALRLMARHPVLNNEEWAGLISSVHAEARLIEVPLSAEDQLLACDVLASVQATDVQAAATYAHLAATYPEAVQPIHAWLYARAACEHGATYPADLELFGRTFRDAQIARTFFANRQWDFDEVEYTFLERASTQAPGRFPEVLGPDYPTRGQAFLLERSRKLEEAGNKDQARRTVEVLLNLDPQNRLAHDRLACLHYRRGDLDQALALLRNLHQLAPTDPWPLIRQAILEQERGNAELRAQAIDRALGLTKGQQRAAVAFLGARLALRESLHNQTASTDGELRSANPCFPALQHARQQLEVCLHDDPNHVEALWCLAALRSVLGEQEELARQAPLMDRPTVQDARFHYMGAVCYLAGKDYPRAVQLAERALSDRGVPDSQMAVESHFLLACAYLRLGNPAAAQAAFQKVVADQTSPSAVYARALLGQMSLERGAYDEAAHWWTGMDPARRAEWQLDEPLRQMVFLAGLTDLEQGRYEQAADRFREASKLGLRDKRLGALVTLALVKAGQRLLYQQATESSPS